MQKQQLFIISFLVTIFIAGCTGGKIDSQPNKIGKLILNQDRIKAIEVVKGATEQTSIKIADSTNIATLIGKVKEIPVNRLSISEDTSFMPKRIQDDSVLHIRFYSDDICESLDGALFIWSDGYLYTVDINSMKGNQRTISYLSESKYPEIYKWIIDTLIPQ